MKNPRSRSALMIAVVCSVAAIGTYYVNGLPKSRLTGRPTSSSPSFWERFMGSTATPDEGSIEPPQRDASTPQRQSGFNLLAIQSRESAGLFRYGTTIQPLNGGGTALWMDTPWLPELGAARGPDLRDDFTVTARPDEGEPRTLSWFLPSSALSSERRLCVVLPAGYSDTTRHFDITVRDRNGNKARWRLIHLPRSKPVIADPVKVVEQVHAAGVLVKASAFRAKGIAANIQCRIEAIGTPQPAGDWELEATGGNGQWELPEPSIPTRLGIRSFVPGISPEVFTSVRVTYPSENRYVRVRGALRRFETYTERLTFDTLELRQDTASTPPSRAFLAVKKATRLETPNGIAVVVLPGPVGSSYGNETKSGLVGNIALSLRPGSLVNSLPQSPLYKKYRTPVSISLRVAPPYQTLNPERDFATGNMRIFLPGATVAKPLTLLVTQRTIRDDLPLEFIVPVTEKDPPPPNGPKTP